MSAAWPADGLEPASQCPVCDSDNRERLYEGLEDRLFFCAPGQWDMYSCKRCTSAWLDPRPTPETIGLAYARYSTHDAPEGADFSSLSLAARLRQILRNGYRNHRYGTRDRPASVLGVPASLFMPNAGASIDAEMRHLPRPLPGQRLLDLGCGSGAFLQLAAGAGWDVVGVDFDVKAVDVARRGGLDIRVGGVEVLDPATERFDVITMSHVIEHVHRPLEVLQGCYELLHPGGLLWIETPNIASTGHVIYRENWRGLEPPRHLVLFSQQSLHSALTKTGFAEIAVQPHRQMCLSMFQESRALADGRDASAESQAPLPRGQVSEAEKIASAEPAKREFITLKAWKK